MQVSIFKNHDLNNLLVDYCQVHNIVKFDSECYIIKVHNKVYGFKTKNNYHFTYSYYFYKINNNVKICRQYIQTVIKNIHADNEVAFRLSCANGNLEVVKFLWSLNQGIDIHAFSEEAFEYSCRNGHLEVVQWLWSLNQGINIHANYKYAFISSCFNGHLPVVEFLITLYKQQHNTSYLELLNNYPNIKSQI